ncbi:MAG: heme-binding protein [Planctomycetes bacterium]|nr:heme-binding protein [Planctomycetota bacterium]
MLHKLILGVALTLPLTAQQRLLTVADLPARATAAALLEFGIAGERELAGEHGEQRLRDAVATARRALPEGSTAWLQADELVRQAPPRTALRRAAQALLEDLTFRPVAEAELPEGMPGFLALDELELRRYPAYRMVRTDGRRGSMGAFWPLFRHIQSHDIAMTTPVQVDYQQDGERRRMATMAFLYGSPELGETGVDGNVEVVDVEPMTVLTIGSTGYDSASRLDELQQRIDAWLAAHPEWERCGDPRSMGYNSPSVSRDRRYFELQQPVRQKPHARRLGDSI